MLYVSCCELLCKNLPSQAERLVGCSVLVSVEGLSLDWRGAELGNPDVKCVHVLFFDYCSRVVVKCLLLAGHKIWMIKNKNLFFVVLDLCWLRCLCGLVRMARWPCFPELKSILGVVR